MPLVHIKDLIDGATERWGDPAENIGRLVPFGINIVDERLLGVPIDRGGIFGIQGSPGSRKTTFLINVIANQCLSGRLPQGYHIAIDTLESGMTIERYADIVIAIVATKFLVYWHWNESQEKDINRLLAMGLPQSKVDRLIEEVGFEENGRFVRETVLRPEFFIYGRRTPRQQEAIKMSRAIVRNWPIFIFGVSEHSDPEVATARTTIVTSLAHSVERWKWLSEERNMRELAIDHLQEYAFADNPNDYEKMKRVVGMVAQWQKACRGVAWVVTQIGVTSAREARRGGTKAHGQGGQVLEAQSQVMWEVSYDEERPNIMCLKRPIKSRVGMHNDMAIPIEPNSGAFIGLATEMSSFVF